LKLLHPGDFLLHFRVDSRERLRKKIHLNSSATKKFYVDLLNDSLNLETARFGDCGRKIACLNEKIAARRPPESGYKVFTGSKCVFSFFPFVSFIVIPGQSTKHSNYWSIP